MNEDNTKLEVGGKYIILDAKTGKAKSGEYFVLKLNSKDPNEEKAVGEAMKAYAIQHRLLGNKDYADRIESYFKEMSNKA